MSPKAVTSEHDSPAEGEDKKQEEKGSVSNEVPTPKIPQGGILVKEAVSKMEEDEMKYVDKSSSTKNEGHSTKTSKSENETLADQRKSENLGENNKQDFEQHNSAGLSKKQPSDIKDVHQVANDLAPREEPSNSSLRSKNPSFLAIGGSKNNENSSVKENHEETKIASEKNKTTNKLDCVEDVEHKTRTQEQKKDFTTAGEVSKREKVI